MFANLSPGSIVHVLSLKEGMNYSVGTLENVSYSTNNNYNPSFGIQNMGSFITLRVNMNSKSITVDKIPANGSVGRDDYYLVTETKDEMISQVETLLQNSKNVLNNIKQYEYTVKECENVLRKISPAYAKETDRDNAIISLNTRVDNLDTKLDKILSSLVANNNIGEKQNVGNV